MICYEKKYLKYVNKINILEELINNNQIGGSTNGYLDKNIQKYGDFAKIGFKYKTDKVTHHNYYKIYPEYLEKYRKIKNMAMLEIGVDKSRSLYLWLDYFPNAFIYGIDIDAKESGDRYKVFKCDQSDLTQLEETKNKILNQKRDIFFIIDDGSHVSEHQILTFNNYFDTLLVNGGCYIIEDIETSYWTKNDIYGYKTNYGYHNKKSIIEIFKNVVDDINNEFLTNENKQKQEQNIGKIIPLSIRKMIKTITFGKNCIIIMKKDRMENDVEYRFSSNL